MEVRACMRWLVANPQPSYLRLGKAGEPSFHASVPEVAAGRWLTVSPGDVVDGDSLLTTGATLGIAMERQRCTVGPRPTVQTLPLWGMASKPLQAEQVSSHSSVTTFEDHLRDGGFGSWLMEAVVDTPTLLTRLRTKALDPRVCGTVGSQATLNAWGGLSV